MQQTGEQRREEILNRIVAHGHAAIRDTAVDFGVSEATIRRDLRSLADAGRVELVYGGATLPRTLDFSIESRALRNVEAKRICGKLAADLVTDGEMLYVDSGTTCFEMRHHLSRRKNLSVIVNSTRLAVELGNQPDIRIIQIGGHYRPERMDTYGPLATHAIDQLRGYLAFIGADGLDMDFGPTASDIHTADLYRHVMRNARETILLVDHTKFLVPSLYRLCAWSDISRIITDSPPPPEWREFLHDAGIGVLTSQLPAVYET